MMQNRHECKKLGQTSRKKQPNNTIDHGDAQTNRYTKAAAHGIEAKRNRRRRLGVVHKTVSARIVQIPERRRIVHIAAQVELHDEGLLETGPVVARVRRAHECGATGGGE